MTARRSLRIVHVVCTDEFAGVERYVATLARELARRGCGVTVLGGSQVRMPRELAGAAVDWRAAATLASAIRGLVKLRDVDVVHAHMTTAEAAVTLARPMLQAPSVSTRHFASRRGSSAAARVASRAIRRSLGAQIAVSNYVANAVEGPCEVIYTGICGPDDVVRASERQQTVLIVARLEREKRVDVSLRLWSRSGLGARGWRLVIAGDGAERAPLEQLAIAMGISDQCQFVGNRSDVADLLDGASIMLATCPVEAFGLAVVEAMAHAVPIVAVSQGANLETVGLSAHAAMFDLDDIDAGVNLLVALAGDPALRDEYGADLRRIQRSTFALGRQVDQILALYRRVAR